MSYLTFLLIFLVVPSVGLWLLDQWMRRGASVSMVPAGYHWQGVGILALIALIWTTPWDNYLVSQEVWTYGTDRILGTIGYVPIEEYCFFLLEPILVGVLLCLLLRPERVGRSYWRKLQIRSRGLWILLGSLCMLIGLLALRTSSGTYLGLILIWSTPPLMIQWVFDPDTLKRNARVIFLGTLMPTVYLSLADGVALTQGIWRIEAATSLGLQIGPLPVEEILFFFVTSLLLCQGLVLWHSLNTTRGDR